MVARRIEMNQEEVAGQAVAALLAYRPDLLEAAGLLTHLSMHLGIAPADLLPKICYKGRKKRDSKREYDKKQRATVKARDNATCFHCGESHEEGDVDHIIPWSKGGKTTNFNGVWTDAHHNRSRGAKLRF